MTPAQVGAFAGLGDEFSLTALVTDTLGTPLPQQGVTWSIAPGAGAAITVSADGLLTVTASATAGTYALRATRETAVGEAAVHVLPRPAGALAFVSSVAGAGQVFLKDFAVSGTPVQVTSGSGPIAGLAIDPVDGTIVFGRGALPAADLFRVNRDGTGLVNLTNDAASQNQGPAIHPITRNIYFTQRVNGDLQVVRMAPQGGPVVPVTAGSQSKSNPAISPDGQRLAWTETFPGFNTEIMVSAIDGSGTQRLTDRTGADVSPAWGTATRVFWIANVAATGFDIMTADLSTPTTQQTLAPQAGTQTSPTGACLPNSVTYLSNASGPLSVVHHDLGRNLVVRYPLPDVVSISFLRRSCG